MKFEAIETLYKGCRFRSRLEARWAVLFEAVGIKWEYEIEGFNLGEAGLYLPDFYLPDMNLWAEVKGREFTREENEKAKALASMVEPGLDGGVLKLVGLPEEYDYIQGYCNTYYGVKEAKYLFIYSTNPEFPIAPPVFFLDQTAEIIFPIKLSDREYDNQAEDSIWMYTKGIAAAKAARFEHGETPK